MGIEVFTWPVQVHTASATQHWSRPCDRVPKFVHGSTEGIIIILPRRNKTVNSVKSAFSDLVAEPYMSRSHYIAMVDALKRIDTIEVISKPRSHMHAHELHNTNPVSDTITE